MKSLSTTSLFSRDQYQNLFNLLGVFNFALLLAISASLLFAEPKSSNADTVSASAGSSVYSASISNNDSVTIPITPTNTQAEYTSLVKDSKIIFNSTCPKGATVQINTNSTTDNALTRTGSDTGIKTIDAVAGSLGLTDNTWGYKIEGSGSAFAQVPVSSSPAVLYTSTGVEKDTSINLIYGVKTDNNMPSGTYTNDVVYTVAVNSQCLAYTLKFDTQGGTSISDQSVNYGDTVNLTNYTTTKSGYIFGGWSNGTLDFAGNETTADPNPSNDFTVTLSACWVQEAAYPFDYTGGEQTFTAPCNGYYKLEVWGAQGAVGPGGSTTYVGTGGYGGYSIGITKADKTSKFYINVGGQGKRDLIAAGSTSKCYNAPPSGATAAQIAAGIDKCVGGYNGGRGAAGYGYGHAGSGGATHIATVSGILSNLESYKGTLVNNSYYVSDKIIIVAGGGGVFCPYVIWHRTQNMDCRSLGGNGGGYLGAKQPLGGTQISGGIVSASGGDFSTGETGYFGKGGGFNIAGVANSAGGGGFFGGAAVNNHETSCGGGGSGYIASSKLISGGGITKHMTCYSCATSTVDATRTNSNTTTPSTTATADVARTGNGYSKIQYLGPTI